jgi:hypothetical protein
VSAQRLDQPVVSGSALRSVNFFNGRLLTGDDLRLEQSTTAARLQRAGRLLGNGVAYGLEVKASAASTIAAPLVTVAPGLAVAPSGASLELTTATDLSLYTNDPAAQAGPGGLFADCQPAAPGTYSAGSGVYLLVVGPAAQAEGLAQVSGLGNQAATCNVARAAEALKFRLIRAALDPDVVADPQHLRSHVATMCLGYDAIASFLGDPFGPAPASYGLVDTLRSQILSADEVPLAALGWSVDAGMQFVDLWSVRRRLTRPAAEGEWTSLVSDRRRAEAEAMFQQFQAHVADLVSAPDPALVTVDANFEQLPPVGVLPVSGGTRPGVDIDTFFAGRSTRGPFVIAAAKVEALVRAALPYAPIDLGGAGPIDHARTAPIWLYSVHENLDPRVWSTPPGGAYAVFTSGFAPYAGNAQYALSHFNFANYALHAT